MTDEELKNKLEEIIADAEQIPGVMGDTNSLQAVVSVGFLREILERL
jgi:hypothetical protein